MEKPEGPGNRGKEREKAFASTRGNKVRGGLYGLLEKPQTGGESVKSKESRTLPGEREKDKRG